MPLYAYVCPTCGAERDHFNRVSDRHTHAPVCHGAMRKQITPNLGFVQRDCNYQCPVTGQVVTSNRQRKNIMAEHQLVDANDFKPKEAYRKAKRQYEHNAELAAMLKCDIPDKVLDSYKPALPTTI